MSEQERSIWGHEFLWPDEDGGTHFEGGWVSILAVPVLGDAVKIAVAELGCSADDLRAVKVLMREESEVEAKIAGHEAPGWTECTSRARKAEPFWRIEVALA